MERVDLGFVRSMKGKGRGSKYHSRRTATLAEVQPLCDALRVWSRRELLCFSKARKAASSARTEDRSPRNANAVVANFMMNVWLTPILDTGM